MLFIFPLIPSSAGISNTTQDYHLPTIAKAECILQYERFKNHHRIVRAYLVAADDSWCKEGALVSSVSVHSSQKVAIHPRNRVDCNFFMLVWRQTAKTINN